jgi:hypothetical protein
MASVVTNGPGTPLLTRGKPANLGTITTGQALQFTLAQENASPNGLDCLTLSCATGTMATMGLEASIDGGTTWFGVAFRSPDFTATVINSDTAAVSTHSYDVSGLQAGALFRVGGATASSVVWALFS